MNMGSNVETSEIAVEVAAFGLTIFWEKLRMGKLGGIAMIATGAIIILNILVMAMGGLKVIIGLTTPIALKFLPLNEMLRAWVDVPLSMGLTAYLTGIRPLESEEGMITGGIIDYKVTLSSGGPEDEDIPAVAVIWIQEDAEIDEIQRYVLRCGPLNYPSVIFWLLSLGSLGGMFLSLIVRLKLRGKGSPVAPEPPPEAVVSVIPLEGEDVEKE